MTIFDLERIKYQKIAGLNVTHFFQRIEPDNMRFSHYREQHIDISFPGSNEVVRGHMASLVHVPCSRVKCR